MSELAVKMKKSQTAEGKANREVLSYMFVEPTRELKNRIT